ncbi:MAG: S9 family peptidase [Verrucomicrobia bacterium]|nr:S9 family peptidase [Verrucomicrobiota bacterium]
MRTFLAPLGFAFGGFVLSLSAAVPAAPAEPPVETFFQSPAMTALTFSPNGKYIACLVPWERRMNLLVIDLEKGTRNLLTSFKDRQAMQPFWANDDRILFRVDDAGRESYALYAVNRDGTKPVVLASGYSLAETTQEVNVRFRSVLGRIKGDPKHVLVLANLTYRDWSDVATLNLETGEMTTVIKAPGDVHYYLRDHEGNVRIAVVEKTPVRRVLHREPKGRDWTVLGEHHMDQPGWEPLAFDGDNRTLFIWSDVGRKTRAIYRYDTTARQQLDLVKEDDTYDVVDANAVAAMSFTPSTIFDPAKGRIVGLSYAADRTRFHWIDDEMRELEKKMSGSLPDTVHRPRQFAEDGSKIIFFSSSDRDPGVYYLYDRKRQKLSELVAIKPAIDPEKMSPMRPVKFPARDGLMLHGYLTLPAGREPKNLPLILHPHGGPYGIRDEWQYNDEVQFYASRGYAVLQVNYRGSGGYGRAHEQAGFKRQGLEMQDDLSDGVRWAIAQGVADPGRVVISGASYGGYATMAGLTFSPELYCAGINYLGVTNYELRIPKEAPPDRMYWWHTRIGNLGDATDRKRIRDISPVHFADRVVAPVLMAYGKNDVRVHIDHGFDMERALKKAGKTYEMIIEDEEGHGFRMEERRIGFFTAVDRFLKKYVPPPGGSVRVGPAKVVEMPAATKP